MTEFNFENAEGAETRTKKKFIKQGIAGNI